MHKNFRILLKGPSIQHISELDCLKDNLKPPVQTLSWKMQTRVKRHTAKLLILALWCCFPRVINNSTQIPPASFHPQKLCPLPASCDEQKMTKNFALKINTLALSLSSSHLILVWFCVAFAQAQESIHNYICFCHVFRLLAESWWSCHFLAPPNLPRCSKREREQKKALKRK